MVARADVGYEQRPEARIWAEPSYQAFRILHFGIAVMATIAGVDKFTNLLTDWAKYLSPAFAAVSPLSVQSTMYVVGLVEIVAGFLVALAPRVGGYVVACWLGGIILNLALLGGVWDVALRDLGLMFGALALARLAKLHHKL
ncbi:MAG TPA: hypothetical protein VM686_21990 [Polyangiaceae bacterium]|nr:hypothetical protein [Polyangiaceae bacterium]